MKVNSDKTVPSVFWSFGERICAQLVTLLVSIVLARILSPDDYSVVAIILIFITLANVFVSSGFGMALIQKKDADNFDFSTVLYFSMFLSVVLYIVLFFTAPFISSFYQIPLLTPLIRVLGIRLIFASINTIQHAYLSKQMQFKKFFFSTLIGTLVSSVVGVVMALSGCGAWAIVAQYLSNTVIDTIVISIVSGWRPKIYFSFKRLKRFLPLGSVILATDLVGTLYNQSRGLIISKFYNKTDLSYYNQSEKYTSIFVTNVESSVNKVMVQVQSDSQDNLDKIKNNTRNTLKLVMLVLFPIQVGIALTSFAWIPLFLTEKWIGCIPYVIITAMFYIFFPLIEGHSRNLKALGKGKTILILNLIRHSLGIIAMVVTLFITKNAIIFALVGIPTQLMAYLLFAYFDGRLIKYSFKEQLFDLLPTLGASVIMGAVVFAEHYLPLGNTLVLLIQIFSGFVIYIALCYFFIKSDVISIVKIINKYITAFKNRKRRHYKIRPLYIATAVFIFSLAGVSIYARYSGSNTKNLINVTFRGYDSSDLVIVRNGRQSYLIKGKSTKNSIFHIGSVHLEPGKYSYTGLYQNAESKGNCALQLFDSSTGKIFCQFGLCTSKNYSCANIDIQKSCNANARLIVYEGWNGNTTISPFIKKIPNDSKCTHFYGGDNLEKPMMTFIDDDGDKQFLDKWLPIIEDYNVSVTTAVVSTWIDTYDYCMNWEDLALVKSSGGEVVCHTETHNMDYYQKASTEEIIASYSRAKENMKEHGLDTNTIVYCGDTGDFENVRMAGYNVFDIGIHSGGDTSNVKSLYNKYNLRRYNLITENSSFEYFKTIINDCIANKGWLIWMSHSQYGEFDDDLISEVKKAIEYAQDKGVDIVSVEEGNARISY